MSKGYDFKKKHNSFMLNITPNVDNFLTDMFSTNHLFPFLS